MSGTVFDLRCPAFIKMLNTPDNYISRADIVVCCCYVSRQTNFDFSVNKYQTAVDKF